MLTLRVQKPLLGLVLVAGPAINIFITPFNSTDPINIPKLLLLATLASGALGILIWNSKNILALGNRIFLALIGLFVLDLFGIVVFSGAPLNQQIFGAFGRNTGLVAYLSLAVIAIVASAVATEESLSKVSFSLLGTGMFTAFYSFLQTIGMDPIKWNNPHNAIVGFLGNPNFTSSFLGICGIVIFSLMLRSNQKIQLRFGMLIAFAGFGVLIFRSHSQQGLLVLGGGSAVVLLIYFLTSARLSKLRYLVPFSSILVMGALLVILGTLKIGPLADNLYKVSVRQRGFYWHAAVEMMKNHPIFGVGLDSYGDWYFEYRSINAATLTPSVMSNASHNVFLDFGANGGLPLFGLHLALVILTLFSIFKYLQRNREFNWAYAGLVGAWLGYEAQALISINQIGLAIWGWILMGILIGVETASKRAKSEQRQQKLNKLTQQSIKNKKTREKSMIPTLLAGMVVGFLAILPSFIADMNFRTAQTSGSAPQLIDAATSNPRDSTRLTMAAQALANSNLLTEARKLILINLNDNPRNYNAWQLELAITKPGTLQHTKALAKLRGLNPNERIR
jgi:O-antigen ligase